MIDSTTGFKADELAVCKFCNKKIWKEILYKHIYVAHGIHMQDRIVSNTSLTNYPANTPQQVLCSPITAKSIPAGDKIKIIKLKTFDSAGCEVISIAKVINGVPNRKIEIVRLNEGVFNGSTL